MSKSMMIISGSWGSKKTFKMIPVTNDSPYNEAIYDLDSKVLALIGKEKKESMHMVPKLDDFGELKMMKIGKRANGKDYAEERKVLETYYEYYLDNPEDIKAFINLFAVNADGFDINSYAETAPTIQPVSNLITV